MKAVLATLILGLTLFVKAPAQDDIKVKTSVDPVFPPEAGSYLYGDSIKVAVEVDKAGKVTRTVPLGPLVPCSDRKDKNVDAIQNAAIEAAKATVFQPMLKNGSPVSFNVMLTYRLTPKSLAVADPKKPASPTPKSLPKPFFTQEAKNGRIGGEVEIQVFIDETGRVLSLIPLSGHPALIAGSIDSACNARFEPTITNGQPIKILGKITYKFVP